MFSCHRADIRFSSIKLSHVRRRKKRTNHSIPKSSQESFLYRTAPIAFLRECPVLRNNHLPYSRRQQKSSHTSIINPSKPKSTWTPLAQLGLTSTYLGIKV